MMHHRNADWSLSECYILQLNALNMSKALETAENDAMLCHT